MKLVEDDMQDVGNKFNNDNNDNKNNNNNNNNNQVVLLRYS